MTLLPLITSSKVIESRVIYLVFWILNECIYIGTRKVIYTEYLFGFMRFLIQCFLGTWYCSKAIPSGGFMRVSCTLNRVLYHHFRWSDTSLMRREMKWVLSRWNHVWTVINILWVLEQLQLTSYFWPPIPIWESLILFLSPISQWTPTDLSY